MEPNTKITIESVGDILNSPTFKESTIFVETEIQASTHKKIPLYKTYDIETSCTQSSIATKHLMINSEKDKPFTFPLVPGVDTEPFTSICFRSAIASGEWIFAFLYSNTMIAYRRYKEIWRVNFDPYINLCPYLVCGSEEQVVIANERAVMILSNRRLIRYIATRDVIFVNVMEISDGSFLILCRRDLYPRTYHLTFISKNGEELCSQSMNPIRDIRNFNDGILILYKSTSVTKCYIKWYKKDSDSLPHRMHYKLQYSTKVDDQISDIATHDSNMITNHEDGINIYNDRLELIMQIQYHCRGSTTVIHDNKIITCHNLLERPRTLRFISIPCLPFTLGPNDATSLYDINGTYMDFPRIFKYMDSILIIGERFIKIASTHWSKQNNFLQSKNNRDAIKTLYSMQHYGALMALKDVLDIIVTLAFSIMP